MSRRSDPEWPDIPRSQLRTSRALAAELEIERRIQTGIDEATASCGAQAGAVRTELPTEPLATGDGFE